jgi:hypothetical protein
MRLFSWLWGSKSDAAPDNNIPGLAAVARVLVSQTLAETTQAHLRKAGNSGHEGLVVWSGVQKGDTFHVRTVTSPEQNPIRTSDGVCVVVEGAALHRLNVWLHKNGERLIAQVHSHPTEAFHSSMDDDYAVVTAPGSLSLVVPDFAKRPFAVAECAVFRLTAQGRWVEVGSAQARRLITLLPGE